MGSTFAGRSRSECGVLGALVALAACGEPLATDPGPKHPVVEYVAQQEILTALPVRVSLPRAAGAEHVVVLFRTWGSPSWREMELARVGQTWSGEVSCREVSTVTGDTRYYILALDSDGEVVGGSGSPDWPHLATIVGKLPDGAQALPFSLPPVRCHDPADCPPDFPGCPAYRAVRPVCVSDEDCRGRGSCAWDGYCGPPAVDVREPATYSGDELATALNKVKSRYNKVRRSASVAPRRP